MDFSAILGMLGSAMQQGSGNEGGMQPMGGGQQGGGLDPFSLMRGVEKEQKPRSLMELLARYDQSPWARMQQGNPSANWLNMFGGGNAVP